MTPRGSAATWRIRPAGGGFAAEGPGFYVWDCDRREVELAVREFLRACPDARSVRPTAGLPARLRLAAARDAVPGGEALADG